MKQRNSVFQLAVVGCILLAMTAIGLAQQIQPKSKTNVDVLTEGVSAFYLRVNGVAGGIKDSIAINFPPSMRGYATLWFTINGKKSSLQLSSNPDTISITYRPRTLPYGNATVKTSRSTMQTMYPFNNNGTAIATQAISLWDGFGSSAIEWKNRSINSGTKIGTGAIAYIRADSINAGGYGAVYCSSLQVGGMPQCDGINLYVTANDTIQIYGFMRAQ